MSDVKTATIYFTGEGKQVHPEGFTLVPGKNELPVAQAERALQLFPDTCRKTKPAPKKKTRPKKKSASKK